MSGGSMDYVYLHIKEAAELTEDETITQLLKDLAKVLHDEEWAECCDISDAEYQDTLLKFKRKWLKQEPKTEWIPVSERLPENKTYVLTTIHVPGRQPHARSGWYDDGLFMNDNGDTWKSSDIEVKAWQPLPKPYSEVEQ